MNNCKKFIEQTVNDLDLYLRKCHIKHIVIGISGGIDSAVSLAIISQLKNIKISPFFIDIESNKKSIADAKKICLQFNVSLKVINLNLIYKNLLLLFKPKNNIVKGNLKSRLRMMFLYNEANKNKAIVIGNSNFDELYLGYFTKYGDHAADLMLLNNLLKKDVYLLGKYFNLPDSILKKIPSAELYKNQSDEKELGFKYDDFDGYFLRKKISLSVKNKIEKFHQLNSHKKGAILNKNYLSKHKGVNIF